MSRFRKDKNTSTSFVLTERLKYAIDRVAFRHKTSQSAIICTILESDLEIQEFMPQFSEKQEGEVEDE